MKLENARILLTGAAGGLGHELARQLAESRASLLLAGRDAVRLEALRASLGNGAAIVTADLTRSEGVAVTARAAQNFGINVLINNAGAGAFGSMSFSIRSTSRPCSLLAVRRIAIVPLLGATPYLIAFSMIGCRIRTGTHAFSSAFGIVTSTWSRSGKRTCSMSR